MQSKIRSYTGPNDSFDSGVTRGQRGQMPLAQQPKRHKGGAKRREEKFLRYFERPEPCIIVKIVIWLLMCKIFFGEGDISEYLSPGAK